MRKEGERTPPLRIAKALAALLLTAAFVQPSVARAGSHGGGGQGGGGFHRGPPGGFHGGFAGVPHGGFHAGGFHAHGFPHGEFHGHRFHAERFHHHGFRNGVVFAPVFVACRWGPGWVGLIALILTKATTATDLMASIGIATTRRDITPTYSSATSVGRWFRPTEVSTQ